MLNGTLAGGWTTVSRTGSCCGSKLSVRLLLVAEHGIRIAQPHAAVVAALDLARLEPETAKVDRSTGLWPLGRCRSGRSPANCRLPRRQAEATTGLTGRCTSMPVCFANRE